MSRGISVEVILVSDTFKFPQDHIAKHTYTKGPVGPEITE